MLERSSWWAHAEGLEVGQRRTARHDCGDGLKLIVNRDERGYHAWCYRCNDKGWSPPPQESLTEKLARLQRLRDGDLSVSGVGAAVLPSPQVRDVGLWPEGARLWLYKAGIGKQEIGHLGAFYHAQSDRVVLPLGGYWQARAYQPGRSPKYLGPSTGKSQCVPCWGNSDAVTLTEDVLSAFKVGLVGEGWAMLGTSPSDILIARLMRRKPALVNVWLDSDPPGRRAAAKTGKVLRSLGLVVKDICTVLDPKMLPREEIRRCLHTQTGN